MKKDNIVQKKSYVFALKIIELYKFLCNSKKEFVLSKQILKSGTSIGGQSKKDFYAKLSISYKEARETHYWIRLLTDSNYIEKEKSNELLNDCEELLKLIGSILKTIRNS